MKFQLSATTILSIVAIILDASTNGQFADDIEDCIAVKECDRIISSDDRRRFYSMDYNSGESTKLQAGGSFSDIAISAGSDSFSGYVTMFAISLRNIYRILGFCRNRPADLAIKIGEDFLGSNLNAMSTIDDGSSDILILSGEDGIIREFDVSTSSGPNGRDPTTQVGTFPCDGTSGDMAWNANDGLIYASIKGCTEAPYSCGGDALFAYNRSDQKTTFKACFTLNDSPVSRVYGMAYLGMSDTMVIGTIRSISPYGNRLYSVNLESGIMKPGPDIVGSYFGTNGLTTVPCPVPYCNTTNEVGGCCDDFCEFEVVQYQPSCASNWTEECVDLACGDGGICGDQACTETCLKGKDLLCTVSSTTEGPSNAPSDAPSIARSIKKNSSKSSKKSKSDTWMPSQSPSNTPFCNIENTVGGCCHDLCEALVVQSDPHCSASWDQSCVEIACGASGICSSLACDGECVSSSEFCAESHNENNIFH